MVISGLMEKYCQFRCRHLDGAWSMEHGVWSMEYGTWSMELKRFLVTSLLLLKKTTFTLKTKRLVQLSTT